MSATNPTPVASMDSLLQTLSPTTGPAIAESSTATGAEGETDFNTLLGTFFATDTLPEDVTGETAVETTGEKGEWEKLHSSLEEKDTAETAELLATLDNQASQQLTTVTGIAAQQAQRNEPIPASGTGQPSMLADAVQQSLGKAMEGYMPKDNEEKRLALALSAESPAADSRITAKAASGSYIPVIDSDKTVDALKALPEKVVAETNDARQLSQDAGQLAKNRHADNLAGVKAASSQPLATAITTGTHSPSPEGSHITPVTRQEATPLTSAPVVQQQEVSKGHEAWLETVGQRLTAMVGERRQEASIRLDPPELGSLHVRLVVEDNGVSVQFQSAVSHVREMLEGQADRLRYALADQGLDLVNVDVGKEGHPGQQDGFQENQHNLPSYAVSDDSEGSYLDIELDTESIEHNASSGFINTFA